MYITFYNFPDFEHIQIYSYIHSLICRLLTSPKIPRSSRMSIETCFMLKYIVTNIKIKQLISCFRMSSLCLESLYRAFFDRGIHEKENIAEWRKESRCFRSNSEKVSMLDNKCVINVQHMHIEVRCTYLFS